MLGVRPYHVVGLDGEHFLQGVGGAVGFERPDLHFAEALAAELRLAAQRLLGDQASTGPVERAWILSSTRVVAASSCRCTPTVTGLIEAPGRYARRSATAWSVRSPEARASRAAAKISFSVRPVEHRGRGIGMP